MNQRKLGIFLSYLNITLQSLLGFLYIPILLHYIGKSEYGLYQLMGSLIAYFGIMDFGLSAAVIRFYAKYLAMKDRVGMENILAIALRCYGAVMGVMLIAGGAVYTMLDAAFSGSMTAGEVAEAKDIFLLLLLNIVITLSTMVFRSVINAHERFLFLKGLETVQLVLQPMLVVLLLMHHPSAFSVALVQTGLNLVLSLARVYYCFVRLHVRIRYHYWSHELMVSFRRLALSVFAVTLIDQVFWKTNQIILGGHQRDGSSRGVLDGIDHLHGLYAAFGSDLRGLPAACDDAGGGEGDVGEIVRTFHSDRSLAVLSSSTGRDRIHPLRRAIYSPLGG